MRITRRRALASLGIGAPAALLARPVGHLAIAAYRDRGSIPAPPAGFAEDASRLETVAVETHFVPGNGTEEALRDLLFRARAVGRPIAIAGARHTMGGQTSAPGAVVIDTSEIRAMSLDEGRDVLTVGSGARWAQVLAYLDPLGRSVAVMQGYSSFSVGGSLGANVHGWQHDRPPIASTVESLRIMLADGRVVRASRSENQQLFALVLGGYGLFGVVIDVDLRVVDNALYSAKRWNGPADGYVDLFERHVRTDPAVRMAYGRISVSPKRFLTEALLTVYSAEPVPHGALPRLRPTQSSALQRAIFRGSEGSVYGKELRWQIESAFGGEAGSGLSRNQILDEPAALFENRDPQKTDILQEYFVPHASFASLLARMRRILPRYPADLLNVTVRTVLGDDDSFLRYADRPMFALVLLFCIPRTAEADRQMMPLTRELVDAAISLGGRYYLPYRLHATPEQLARAYPQARAFFEAKRTWDPDLLFRNHFFGKYAGV
jgi:FAD/FMN-containing dehydrogenase